MAAERDDLRDRQSLGRGPRLREQRDLAGELTGAEQRRVAHARPVGVGTGPDFGSVVGCAPEGDPAVVDLVQPGERAQERGLPAAVRPHQGGRAARFQGDGDAVDDRSAAVPQHEVVPVEGGDRRCRFRGDAVGRPEKTGEHRGIRTVEGARTTAPSTGGHDKHRPPSALELRVT